VTPEQLRGKLERLLAGQKFEKVELDVAVEDGKIKVRAPPGAFSRARAGLTPPPARRRLRALT
jgi:hypothetical protein